MERKQTRSSKYQYLLIETIYPSEMLEAFPNEESVYKRLNPFIYNDEIAELEDQLKVEFWRVVNSMLTERQKEIIKYYAEGKTQTEIAKILNVNQSSITKSIHGNVDYKGSRKTYGGSARKLRKIIENDEAIQKILKRISELRDENWL